MTTGQMVFYSGVGLLILTIFLCIVFWIKKPQYIPGSAVYNGSNGRNTQKLRSGYPTDRLTIRREPERPSSIGTVVLHEETERLTEEQTEPLAGTGILLGTEVLDTVPLVEQQTEKLEVSTVPLAEDTTPLQNSIQPLIGETEMLGTEDQRGQTVDINGTTPLSDS